MKILVTTKLSDRKFTDKITPLVISKQTSEIEIVRYKKGKDTPKIRYFTLPNLLNKNLIIQIFSLFLLLPLRLLVNRPDILIGIYYVPYGFFVQFYGKLFRIPTIVNLIGSDINYYSKNRYLWFFLKKLMSNCNFLTTTGNKTKKFLIDDGFPASRVTVLPNPIDDSVFYPIETEKEYDVITISNLIKRKRIDLILKAISQIKKDYSNIRFAIVGDGPAKKNLIKLVEKFDLKNNVEFLGHRNDIPQLLRKSRIFILSSNAEGLPVALMEAMATGLAVITTDVGDTEDIIEDEVNGLLINPSSSKAIFEALKHLLDNPKEIERIGFNAINIRNTNSLDMTIKKWDKILSYLYKM